MSYSFTSLQSLLGNYIQLQLSLISNLDDSTLFKSVMPSLHMFGCTVLYIASGFRVNFNFYL